MAILYMLCGPSGVGKTTWAQQWMRDNHDDIRYVSRDEIRFSMLKDKDDYFANEKEVFRKFVGTIRQTLIDGFDVIADATHLTEFSRRKLTQAIDMNFKDYKIIYIVFNADVETCIERNNQREGRAKVPETVIRNMCRDFRYPSLEEDERAIDVIEIG